MLIIVTLSTAVLITLMIVLLNAIVRHPERINGVIVGVIIFFSAIIILLLREMKFKWNAIEITDNGLLVSSFLGLGPTRKIRFNEITGYNSSWEPSRTSRGLAIYIYENHRRTIEITDEYCRNFGEFKNELRQKIKELGGEEFKIFKKILNAFGVPIKLTPRQNKG